MLCLCGFELYSRWVPLLHTKVLNYQTSQYLVQRTATNSYRFHPDTKGPAKVGLMKPS